MADYDGNIDLGINLSVKDVVDKARDLQKTLQQTLNNISGEKMSSEMSKLKKSIDNVNSSIDKTIQEIEQLNAKKLSYEDYESIKSAVETYRQKLLEAYEAKKKLADEGVSTNDPRWKEAQENIDHLKTVYEELVRQMEAAEEAGKNVFTAEDQAKLDNYMSSLEDLNDKLATEISAMEGLGEKSSEALNEIALSAGQINPEIEEAVNKFNTLEFQIEQTKKRMKELEAAGVGVGYAEYDRLTQQLAEMEAEYKQVGQEIEAYKNRLKGAREEQDKTASSAKKLGQSTSGMSSKLNSLTAGLGSVIKKFAIFAIGVSTVQAAFKKIKAAVMDGLTSMAKMNGGINSTNTALSRLQSSLNYLKGSFAAAFQPLLTVVSPILSKFIDQIAAAVNAIGMLIAKLTGAKSYMKATKTSANFAAGSGGGSSGKSAQEKYEEAVKKAQEKYDKQVESVTAKRANAAAKAEEKQAAAAKKLAKEQEKANGKLAAFDDLNVLGVETMEDVEDAMEKTYEDPELELPNLEDYLDGGAGTTDPFGLEEVPLDDFFGDWFDKILAFLERMKQAFLDGFNSTWEALDLTNRINRLKDLLKSIGDTLLEIFTDPQVNEAMMSMFESFMHMVGSLAADLISIGVSIATFVLGGIEQYLSEHKDRIKDYLIDMFTISTDTFKTIEDLGLAIADIFTVLESEEAISFSAHFIGIFSEAFMTVTELAAKFGRDLVHLISDPIIENKDNIKSALQTAFGQLDVVLASIERTVENFGQKLNSFYDEHVQPFMQSITDGLTELFEYVLGLYDTYVAPFVDLLVGAVSDLFDNHISPLLTHLVDLLAPVIDLLKLLWENILVPFFEFIALAAATLFNALTILFDFIVAGIEVIVDIIDSVVQALTILLEFIVEGFTEGWDTAFDNLKEKFSGWAEEVGKFFTIDYWKELGGNIISGLKKGIEEGWETFKDNAGAIGQKIISKFRKDTDTNSPSKKAEDVGVDIVAGLFLPFSESAVATNVGPFAQKILSLLRETLTGSGIYEIGAEMLQMLVNGLADNFSLVEEFLFEKFTFLSESLLLQFEELLNNVFVPTFENYLTWFDEEMNLWWNDHVLIWFETDTWQNEIFTPFFDFIKQKWHNLMEWWDESVKTWYEDLKSRWNKLMEKCKRAYEKFLEQLQEFYDEIKNATDETFTAVQDTITDKINGAKDAVQAACEEMKAAIEEVIALMEELESMGAPGGGGSGSSSGGIRTSGGGGARVSSGGPRTFMPMLDIMHFEDNLGMSAFQFPELATGAVIPPNREFLAVLGDQNKGVNIETPLATMIEAFRSVMDEYMGGTHQSAVMEVDGETFARLMMPHVMDEMNRLGYNTEIIEGV